MRIQIDTRVRMNYKNGNAEGSGGLGDEQDYGYINGHFDIGVY